ncbi:MAG: MinD/ParA family protein [Spirochaetaceae bacterium]|nr:MAG: MinD/ParA family protein [Spirochaetaceae bacterium]
MIINEANVRKVIPIAGGKGGVGKSVITANLGILLSSYAKHTVAIDLDLGGSNLHTYLGMKNRNTGIGNFLSDRSVKFDELIIDTAYRYLRFIPGDVLVAGLGNLQQSQRKSVIARIDRIDADYILMDLGSGTGLNVIDFFLSANSGFVVTTPQTPAILNAYSFLKNVAFRQLQRTCTAPKSVVAYLKDVVRDKTPGGTPTIRDILKKIRSISAPAGKAARQAVAALKPQLIINMAEAPEDIRMAENLRDLIAKNLEINIGCLGVVYYDPGVNHSVRALKPFVVHSHDSIAAVELDRIAQKIIHSPRFPDMPIDTDEYESSFELAEIEAANDFEEIEQSDATPAAESDVDVSHEEYAAIIAAQRHEIQNLKGTVRMLTMNQR